MSDKTSVMFTKKAFPFAIFWSNLSIYTILSIFTGPQSKKFYERKYRPTWEREFPFISKAPDGSEYAYCKLCRDYLAPKVNDIRKHMYTMKHRKRAIASGLNVKQESVTLVAGSQGQQVIQLFVYFSIVN